MSLSKKQQIFAENFGKLLAFIFSPNTDFTVSIGEVFRPPEMQRIYVQTGRSKTMKGQHPKKLAVDLYFFKDGKLTWSREDIQAIGDYWESLHPRNEWGGNWKSFKDVPHFQMNG